MSAILLILAPDRFSPAAVERALDAAERLEAILQVLYVIDPEEIERIQRVVADTGFVGIRACEELSENIRHEAELRGEAAVREIEALARERRCGFAGSVINGPFVETALRLIQQVDALEVFVPRRPGSRLRRFVRGSPVEALREAAPCPVTIVEASEACAGNE